MAQYFDVAKWSTEDIKSIMVELDIKVQDQTNFINDVIDDLENNFDASIGINWCTIKDSVNNVNEYWRD